MSSIGTNPPPTSASDERKTPFINLFLIALTALILFSFAVAPVSAEDVNQIYVDIDSANALAKALNESAVDTASQGENAYVGDDDKTVIMKNSVNLTKILKFINSDEIKLITEEGTSVHINCSALTPTLISLDKMILIDNGKLNLTSNETNAGHLIFDGYNPYSQSTRIIAIGQNGCLNMSDGVTLKNCTRECVSNEGTFNMFGGNITGNGDLNDIYVMGYGIYNYYSGTINMYGGNITGNDEGVNNHGTFNMSGGNISNNGNSGVCIYEGTFNMSGGNIIGNNFLGVRIDTYRTFIMSDGTISNNKYGVYNKGIFEMSNDALVAENNEVLLASDKFITLAGAINSGKGALNITHNSFSAGSTIVRGSSLSTPSTDNFKLNPSIVNFKLGVRGTDLKLCYNLTSDRITIVNKTYDGTTQNPDVKYNGNTITKDTDYTLSGDFDKTSAGDYTSTVTGIGNYEGTISGIAWNISKAAPIATDFTLNRTTAVFTGQPLAVDVTNNSLEGLGALTGPYYSGTNYPINLTPPTAIGTYTINITLAVGTNYTEIDNLTVGTFTITSSNPPAPVNNGGSSENTGNGKYSYYTRTIENNGEETADGIEIKFGTSPIVGSVILPKGSSGQVILHVYSTEDFPQSEADEYLFDITVGKTAEGQSQIKFKLPASLLKKYGINAQQIKLYHENKDTGVWELLKVEFSADGEYISFTGFTDSFSKFKIVMDRNAVAEETQTQTPAVTETETAKVTQTNAEPEKPAQAATPTQTQSPLGLIGLISALGTTVLVLRRK